MGIFLKAIIVSLAVTRTSCSIDGLSYMDRINQRPLLNEQRLARRNEGGDPCHPLFWYPRAVPEHCSQKFTPPRGPVDPLSTLSPIRVPIPVPSQPVPYPMPFVPPPMPIPPYHMLPPPPPPPPPMYPMPMPYVMPMMPAGPMMPMRGLPFPAPFQSVFPGQFPAPPPAVFGPQAGLVPGIRGLVSPDGGINIMPFSDAYSNMLENHKHKMIRKHMEYVQKQYGERKNYGRHKKLRKSRRW